MRKIINRKMKFLAVVSIFMLALFGCKNSFEVEEEQLQNVTGKTGITLAGFSFEEEGNERTAFPKYDKTAFTDIELKGKKSAMSGNMTSYKTYATYDDIMRDSGVIELDATAYDFTLTAKCYGATFSSTLTNISIQDGITTKLNFTMNVADETETGLLYLYYPSHVQYTNIKFTVSVGTSEAAEVTYDTDLKRYVYSELLAPQNSLIKAVMENTTTGESLTVPFYAIIKSGAKTEINIYNQSVSDIFDLYSYSVTYNANGSSSADTVQKFNPNSSIEYCTFDAPEGKKFCGWNTSSDGSGTRYSAGDTPVLDSDTTLYAQWVTYDTATSTYTISSADELRAFFSYAKDEISTNNAKLLEDVTISDWCVPGSFAGTFDGNGKTLTISSVKEVYSEKDTSTDETKTYSGFLGILRGTVKSLIIKNSAIGSTKCDYAGAVAGKINSGTVDSVNVERTTVKAKNSAGMIAGYNYYGDITNCYTGGNATLTTVTSYLNAGGITGQNNGEITNCTVDAITISAGSSGYAGGITGININKISSSKLFTPNASVNAKYAAGIAGKNENYASITGCEVKQEASSLTTTTITGISHAGGIAALNAGKIDNPTVSSVKVTTTGIAPYTGGIAGYNDTTGTIVTGGTVDINYDSALDGNYGYVIGYNANTTAGAVTTDIVCSNSKAIFDNVSYDVSSSLTKKLTLDRTTKITLSVTDNSGGGAIYAYLSSEESTSTSPIAQTGKVDGTTKTVCAGYLPKGTYYIGLENKNWVSNSTGTYTITAD